MPVIACLPFSAPTLVSDASTLAEIFRFRVRVWRETGALSDDAFPDGCWRDRFDASARHWIIRNRDNGIAAAARQNVVDNVADLDEADEFIRYGLRFDGPIAAPSRVVVCQSAQGCGLAAQLLDLQDSSARIDGAVVAVRQASPNMLRLLVRRGWTIHGPASADPRFPKTRFQVATKELRT